MQDESVAKFGNVSLKVTAFGGHGLLCRKCVRGEAVEGQGDYRQLDGIVLPKALADRTNLVEIVAVGSKVGTKTTKAHNKRFGRGPYAIDFKASVGDLALCLDTPNAPEGIKWLTEKLFFIEESIPLAYIRRQEIEE